ncbi:uncharacterized protein mslnb isoform X26 [Dicentrarchus labrax]|uniref:uncharacterized protein mslnb isoform X7 n=1 Tax=Dicentrarchus labrax TaxID=13489 RepID=UPI0021F55F5E|nr:uncharacterized protein mslnb isoform X7 [Dicentrarchus labrax]XP_051242483.1 uncharacterized protein mslnb isoform X13 [Dicentrarchus labrax]XP_051242485.1 uncharacterized protein mslnb isoform X15 [Dicentrarchus labrax]XP_051242487.1 uncharacterized protein mslnb isoform X17 [Dicentrarchus labrax]XP_051242495.1 uncharacterized protein mslnb isoform X24 [Dicentrarchus labrax]XP_051242496.1 uncharacterized protein mslnb isoform X25 [Dicentrarchus labrax]XP_051242497.1 uncharacterized prote
MRSRNLFLLVYFLASCFGPSSAQRNGTCSTAENCGQVPDSTSHFLHCVGLPSTDTGRDHMRRLKGMLEATMDVYTFMRSSMTGVPLLSLQGELALNPEADPLQNEALVQMWMEVKIKPMLKSITKHFLSCLSTKNFSCSTYQTVVRELSHHYSEMNPARQKWIYTFFMYPFLSGDRVAGCVSQEESSEEWLMKNFGAFRVMARMNDFSTLNMVFSGLEVLHLLSPAQKAELLLRPEVAGLDNSTLNLVFHSLLTGGAGPPPTASPEGGHNWTTGYHPSYPQPTYNPYQPPSPHNNLKEVVNGFMMAFRPIRSFVHDFVSFTQETNVSEIRSTTLTQFLLNWTLAELADLYRPQNTSVVPEKPEFDVTNVEDWYQQVVVPLLRRFLPNDGALMHQNITLAFHEVFYLDHGMDNETSENMDVCSITLDKSPCGLTDAVKNVANVLHCAARTNLTMSEETIMRLIVELTGRLNSLIRELSTVNFGELASDFQQIFGEVESPSMTQEHLMDPDFIKLWFQIKLMPLLPDIPTGLLSCLSTKNFSCPVYQTIVAELNRHMSFMDEDPEQSHNIYEHFIYSFLLHHNGSDPQCLSSAAHTADWIQSNFGVFSTFASISDFHSLNSNFSGLEVLPILSPKQMAEMLLIPLPTPPEKDVVIDRVFDFLLESPEDRKLMEVLHYLVKLAKEMEPPCGVYKHIFERLYGAVPSLPPSIEPVTWATIDELILMAPEECVPENIACPITQYNVTDVCRGINSSDLQSYLKTSMEVSCNFTLETYACAQLENFTTNQLVSLLKCNLPGNSSHSKVLWKLLLTKHSSVLDPALDILVNMSMTMVGPSASVILDVIGEIRVSILTDEQLMNSSVIDQWFSNRLSGFLPSASGMFLRCLSSMNLSCHSYQQILEEFIDPVDNMTLEQQHVVLKDFVLRFLSHSGPACVSVSNGSVDWLMENLGPFSRLLTVRDLLDLNSDFNPLEALRLLTPKQSAELLVVTLPAHPDKDVVINMIFDYLTESPKKREFTEFLSDLVMFVPQGNLSCSSYKTLFNRLDLAMATVSPDVVSSIINSKLALSQHIPPGCVIYSGQCTVTMTNETDICVGVNSTMLQLHLDSGRMNGSFCHFAVEEFACASLSSLKAMDLAAMLACDRSSNSSSSRPVWKLLLSKASRVLDEALDLLSNKTLDPRNPVLSMVLDAIREIRLDKLSEGSLSDPAVIQLWFNHRLRPFLPAVSPDFLSCLNTKGLNCSTYQHILQILGSLQPHMTLHRQMSVYTDFIQVYLTSNNTKACVSASNSSADWLMKNLGPFSRLLTVRELVNLNPDFNPLEALRLLTPKQSAELLVVTLPAHPDKDVVINMIFDYLTESPNEMKFTEFLSDLVMFVQQGNLSCSSYKTLFNRLDLAMATVSPDVVSSIMNSKLELSQHIPPGCVMYNGQCTVTMTNETDICVGVNSTMLQLHLDSGRMNGSFCHFAVEEFACASLSSLKAMDLAAMLACDRTSNSSSSRPAWKLLLSKASLVLDETLDLLSNKTLDPRNPVLSMVLDAIREIRLDQLSIANFSDPAIIQLWFNHRLRPFLPTVSPDFLSCLNTKGLNCSTYQHILQILGSLQQHMTLHSQMTVYTHFIQVYLTSNNTAACVSASNGSADWLMKNLGPFSRLLTVRELIHLNPDFEPLEALRLLTPKQSAALLVVTLPAHPDKDVVINMIFDYLTESPNEMKFTEFLSHLVMFVQQGNLSCSSYKTLFNRLDLAMATVSPDVVSSIINSKLALSQHIPPGCVIYSGQVIQLCTVTMTNETDICVGVNSTMLQLHLDSGRMNGSFCHFAVEEFACASLSSLKAMDLAAMLACDRTSNSSSSRPAWKLLLSKASLVLDEALDLLSNKTLDPRNPVLSMVLDAIREIRLDKLSVANFSDPAVIQLWFNHRLCPFLPAVSPDFLSCFTTKGLNCSTYQHILQILGSLQPHMTLHRQMSVYTDFIQVYLTSNNTKGCVSASNGSADWLMKNLGPFSRLLTVRELIHLNPDFNPLEALQLLTPKQSAELLVVTLPAHPDKDIVINMIFDYLTESPNEMKFTEFLSHLVMFVQLGNLSCSSYKTLFNRLDLAMATVSPDVVSSIINSKLALSQHIPPGCVIYSGQCTVTMTNETDICVGVNSTMLQLHLDSGRMNGSFCHFAVEEFACASLSSLKAMDLAAMLACDRFSNSSSSRPVWKLLLSKASPVLDEALDLLSNKTLDPRNPVLSMVLDAIREIRLDQLSVANFSDPAIIQLWFNHRLRPFLPTVSPDFLSCLNTKGLNCSTYQHILQILGSLQPHMTLHSQMTVYTHFIQVYLTSNNTAACVSASNGSADWLMKNLGPFSRLLTVRELIHLNPDFEPLEALRLLTPKQSAALLVVTLPAHPDKDVVINMIFDYLTESPNEMKFTEFLSHLVMFVQQGNLSCSSYKTLFNRLDLAMATVSPDVVSSIINSKLALSQHIPPGCVIYSGQCTVTMTNETDICVGVNSTMLQLHLDSGRMNGSFCHFAVEEFACASLSSLKAMDLAAMLACDRSSNSSSSKPTWKLLLSKASRVLDEALDLLSNKTLDPKNPVLSMVLDAIREIRLDKLSVDSLNDPAFIQLWFNHRLRPFLPTVSPDFLSCLNTKGLNCSTYQHILQILGSLQPHMTLHRQMSVYTDFIQVYLTSNNTKACVSASNGSADWLMKNLGPFSRLLTVRELIHLNPDFNPPEALRLLTPKQSAELLVVTLPAHPDKDIVINMIFDYLTESPNEMKFTEFLSDLVMFVQQGNLSCPSYKTLFNRLDLAMATVSPDVVSSIIYSKLALSQHIPPGCIIYSGQCTVTMTNETDICVGVNSTMLQLHLDSGRMNGSFCHFAVEEFACASLSSLKAMDLAAMLACDRTSNSSSSRPVWKLLLSKASRVLDETLDLLSNKTLDPKNPVLSMVLDAIREIRLDKLSVDSLNDPAFIQLWFNHRLRPFLPAVSSDFLSCLTTKGLNCSTYQHILQILGSLQPHMTLHRQMSVYTDFIQVYLTSNNTKACVSASNGSADWLMKNLGPFSRLLTVRELIHLNPDFNPLEALRLLTPKQSAELLVVTLPAHPDKDVVINMIFDYLTESPNEMKFTEFLSHLVMFVQQGNLSCSSYKTLFNRLDLAMATASPDVVSSIMNSMMALSQHIPPGCIIYSGQCTVTATNQTDICVGVNSTMLQLHLDSGRMNGSFCHFAVEEFACASLSSLKAMDLAAMLACDRSSNSSSSKPTWKLLLSKASRVLDEALDLLSNKTLDPKNPVLSMVLDAIREIRLDQLSVDSLNDPAVIQLWFNHRLRPFLPAVSPDFLSCLTTKGLNCSTYQHILQILGSLEPHMTLQRQMLVYTHFIQVFLTRNNTADVSCSLNINNSGEWLQKNLGGFLALASFQDLQTLYPKFSAMEALPQLTVRQLAEVSATPGQLTAPAQVTMVTKHIPNQHLPAFFDEYSPAILGHENMFLPAVRSAMLQVVFDRANLSDHSVGDSVVLLWLHNRLSPLLVNLSPSHVAPFFNILAGRNCSTKQQGVEGLNSTISSFSEVTQQEIYNHIIQTLRGPIPLQCYGDNYNQSFYSFLERSFMGFQFPNLTTFLSLMPVNRMHQLVNSMPPSALGDFLRRPDVVDNNAELCVIYDNYMQTPLFLETESLPAVVRRPTLPCVWPTALSSSKRSEVNAWFDRRLQNYLAFLTKSLISPNSTNTTSCLAFQKLVSVLGEYNYTDADFTLQDVFNTIKAYLTSVPTLPRCYNDKDPELNSTAWFAEYIGPFMPFLTLEEFQSLGSAQDIQVFTVNPLNIALLNHSALPPNLTNYYTELVYLQDSNFNPLFLPLLCRCVVPGPAFSQLTSEESIIVLHNLTTLCTDLDPQISAALAGNLGDGIDATAISALGNESIGMSTGQITMIKPQDLLFSLSTLSSVVGWNAGQAKTIVLSLMSSGLFQVNSALSLFQLGSLVVGIPSTTFNSISGSQLISASKDPSFLGHLMTAPQIVQQTFVTQIISMNSSSEMIIENVPDDLATEIPRVLLAGFSKTFSVINRLNKKKWKRQQAELFFDVIAVDTATETLGSPNNLSSSVLQGFTCTGVRTIKKVQIKKLIKACRRTGRNKVKLVETQLTCMYNYIKVDSEATSFNLYPPDMLLYYDYSLVPQASCRSYFEQLTDADFSVFSFALSYKLSALFANARSCLGITSTSLTEDNISVLGNMCCTLDASYIENSDPSILEKLKNCPSLTINQVAAVETLLLSGKTPYGTPSTWNEQTLRDLGTLPLYLSSTFYDNFDKKTKRRFLRYFMRVLRRTGVSKEMRKRMRREIRKSIRNKSKRSIENECTVGMISQVTISDETFPFDYDDITQFNCCLSATTVKDNLDAITGKVDDEEYLTIVLSKLKEAYSASSTIPESQVQVLGPASRVATIDDINTWAITEIDTLSSLMDSSNGEWDPSLAKAIISKYLSKEGNKLGSAELNVIGGTNLCSLDVNVLKNISQESLKNADALTLSNCTTEQKKELFTIAVQAFATSTRSQTVPATTYQLIQPYLGGARLAYVQNLAASNISMDMPAFTSLNESVVLNLSVTEVQGLLGTNLADLKSYENQTLVQSWIRSQRQSELETLGVGLVGGRADPTTTNPPATTTSSSTTTAGSGSSSSTTASGSSTTTGNSGGRIRADAGFSFLALLALLVASQHILV